MSAARTLISRSPAETQAIGEQLGARLTPGAVVACTGELGAGKTCFLQGLARGLALARIGRTGVEVGGSLTEPAEAASFVTQLLARFAPSLTS